MGWNKRESVNDNLVILGDDPTKNKRKASGLLASVKPDRAYPDNFNYELVQKDGTSITLAGSASINRMLHADDVGKFVKAEFTGWGSSPNGKFKQVEVEVYEGEATADMKKWPRWAELQNGNGKPAPTKASSDFEDFRGSLEDEDDDLPF
jgi:hypothetical protein